LSFDQRMAAQPVLGWGQRSRFDVFGTGPRQGFQSDNGWTSGVPRPKS